VEKLQEFYINKCESHSSEDFVLLKTDFEKIEIHINDNVYSKIRYLKLNNLVRFLNPKVNLKIHSVPQISNDDLDMEDIDSALAELSELELSSEEIIKDSLEEMIPLYFLPSHIEKKVKDITCGNKRRKIDARLRKVLPQNFINELELNFKPDVDVDIVEYDFRAKHSMSFFKFYNDDEHTECGTFVEIEKKINEVKYRLNLNYVESIDHYFIGDINVEVGLIERDEHEHNDDPLYYHFNFWKLSDIDLSIIFNNFNLYPFNKEVLKVEL